MWRLVKGAWCLISWLILLSIQQAQIKHLLSAKDDARNYETAKMSEQWYNSTQVYNQMEEIGAS